MTQLIKGKYAEAVVYTDNIESGATAQIFDILGTKMVEGEKVRVMPDVHAGSGCVIGYTQTYSGGPIDPDSLGCDLGCSVLSVSYEVPHKVLGDLGLLNMRIRKTIPLGQEINQKPVVLEKEFKGFLKKKLERARSMWPEMIRYEGLGETEKFITKTCARLGMDLGVFWKSLGTLGGGEIDCLQDN